MQALPDSPESLCIAEMGGTEGRDGEPGMPGQLYLNIGKICFVLYLLDFVHMRKQITSENSMSLESTN